MSIFTHPHVLKFLLWKTKDVKKKVHKVNDIEVQNIDFYCMGEKNKKTFAFFFFCDPGKKVRHTGGLFNGCNNLITEGLTDT